MTDVVRYSESESDWTHPESFVMTRTSSVPVHKQTRGCASCVCSASSASSEDRLSSFPLVLWLLSPLVIICSFVSLVLLPLSAPLSPASQHKQHTRPRCCCKLVHVHRSVLWPTFGEREYAAARNCLQAQRSERVQDTRTHFLMHSNNSWTRLRDAPGRELARSR